MGKMHIEESGRYMKELADTSSVIGALKRGIEGDAMSREEALLLIERAEPGSLLEAARSLRDRSKGRTVSYSKKVFIPLTKLCRDYCGYCTFRTNLRRPNSLSFS